MRWTAHRTDDGATARHDAIREALDGAGLPLELVETMWATGEDAGTFVASHGQEARVHSIREAASDCEAADGALGAALAVRRITHGAGPALVACFPPVGN